jgi:hypothetical protein
VKGDEKMSRAILSIMLVLSCSVLSNAAVITVDDDGPADCHNLQDAIALAVDGDFILVNDGIYTGPANHNIVLNKTVMIKSKNGPTHCIIDCQSAEDCFAFRIYAGDPVIEGFTIVQCSNPPVEGLVNAEDGVAIFITNSSATIRNCIFTGNAACIYNIPGRRVDFPEGPHSYVVNCTFYGNSGAAFQGAAGMSMNAHYGGSFNVHNSIFWANEPEDIDFDYHICKSGPHPGMHVNFTMLQSTWQNEYSLYFENCIYEQDPLLADPNNGDFHLKSQAGRWEEFSKLWVQDDVTSPAIDAGDPSGPLGLEPFPNGGFVNMGAYGGTPEASKSWFNAPVCDIIMAGDINGDCRVNLLDFEFIARQWLLDLNNLY